MSHRLYLTSVLDLFSLFISFLFILFVLKMAANNQAEGNYFEAHTCSYCSYQSRRLGRYLRHLKYVHQVENGFKVTCGVDGCQKNYTFVDSLVKHLKRNHSIELLQEGDGEDRVGMEHLDCDVDAAEFNADADDDLAFMRIHEQNGGNIDPAERVQFDYTRTLALFVLKLREQKKLPENACSEVVRELNELFRTQSLEVSTSLSSVLNKNGIDIHTLDGAEQIMSSFDRIASACESFSTPQGQKEYFAQNFEFVEPEEVLLGHDENGKPETYMYIPVAKLLQALLKHDDVFAEVINGHSSQDARLQDFCDGQAFKQNPLFSSGDSILQINLYHDDFQVVNPLGTRIKKYKLAAFYFALGNLPPQYRSKLEVIQLLILCRSQLIKKYGMSIVLQRLVNDLRTLETGGVHVMNGGREYTFRSAVAFLCADNLAAHTLSGLSESFSGTRPCRFCLITREQMQDMSSAQCTLRMPESHDRHVAIVLRHPQLSSTYGVKADSPLSGLQFFHPIWGCPSDLAHDLFEGFGADALEKTVLHFLDQKYFTLPQLNQKIRTFDYAACDRANKPMPFSDSVPNFKVKQTASQCWCLLRLLPLLVSEWVPIHDICLLLLVDFLDIVDWICAPSVLPGEVHFMSQMLSHFLQRYFTHFEEERVKPKAHFLTHYARQMLLFGPLIHCWTLRFEGKHNYFKEIANRTKNRKNICKTLSYRHQYQQSLYHTSECFLSAGNNGLQSKKGTLVPVRLLQKSVQDLLLPVLGGNENVYQTSAVTVNGMEYSSGSCVIRGFEMDAYVFGKIVCVFVIGGMEYLLLDILRTEEFKREIHGYIVSPTDSFKLCRVSELLDYHPLGVYPHNGTGLQVVILKYHVPT